GCQPLVGEKLLALEARLDATERRAAEEIVARYGHEALRAQGIVEPDFSCRTDSPATLLDSPAPEYPHSAGGVRRPALVITVLTIGADGLARDPEILLALPGEGFAASAVEAWLNSRFAPATRAGAPVESRLPGKLGFGGGGGRGVGGRGEVVGVGGARMEGECRGVSMRERMLCHMAHTETCARPAN